MYHTITLPVALDADWTLFQWPDRSLADRLIYNVDAASWLADSGEQVTSVTASETNGLVAGPISYLLTGNVITGWATQISGGQTGPGAVRFVVNFVNTDACEVNVSITTRAVSAGVYQPGTAAAGTITIGGAPLSVGGQVITIGGV